MNRFFLTVFVIWLCSLTGCQSDSDYTLGTYGVVTTVNTSTCSENLSGYFQDLILPTGFSTGQTQEHQWVIRRVGITGSGTDKIDMVITSSESPAPALVLSGSLENGFVRAEVQRNIVENEQEFYRFILIYGLIDDENFTGEIRTLLSDTRDASSTASLIPPFSPCEIYEEFVGNQYSE